MTPQSPPTNCPSCGEPNPKLVSSFPGSLNSSTRADSTVAVYKCKCGYLFAVADVHEPKPPATKE